MELYIKANEYHIEAKIQGNKDSLERLKTTIEMALSRGSACSEGYFDEEGEEYSVLVMLVWQIQPLLLNGLVVSDGSYQPWKKFTLLTEDWLTFKMEDFIKLANKGIL